MMAYIFGLIAYLGWGSGDVFGTFATRRIGPYLTTFWAFAFGALLGSLYIPFAIGDLTAITPAVFALNIFLGILYVGGNLTFNEALRLSSAPIVGTVGGSFAALTIILSYFFLDESISSTRILLIGLVFTGVFITTTAHNQKKDKHFVKGIILALISMIVWGIYFTFNKVLMRTMGWFWPNYLPMLLFPLIALYMRWKKIPFVFPTRKVSLSLFLNALTLRGGDFAFNIGASMGLTATVAPLGGAYPTLFAVLSYFIFRDPINKIQLAGIIIALVGLVALGFVSI